MWVSVTGDKGWSTWACFRCQGNLERLRGGRVPQSAESPNAAIDSRLKYEKIDVGFSDQGYMVINLSLFSVSG